jgi:uncharacterized membrane protein
MEIILSILILSIFCLAWALYFVFRSMWSMQADIERLENHVENLQRMLFPVDKEK